jgi:hypothetical protein
MHKSAQYTLRKGALVNLTIGVCLAVLTGCSSTTSMDQVWHDPGRTAAPLGKTLVIAVAPRADTTAALENEWVKQLQGRGIDAQALHVMLPGDAQPDKQRVVELAKANAINSVLVTRIVDKKTIERQVAVGGPPIGAPGPYGSWSDFYGTSRAYASTATYTVENEVAVVETNLYDVSSEKRFWSARSDTFLAGSANELIHGFVQTMMKEMAKSKVL